MKSPLRGGFVTGLVVGLLIGLAVALGVALYITKAPVPFINKVPQRSAEQDAAEAEKNKHWDPNAPLAGKSPARPAASGVVVGSAPVPASSAAASSAPVRVAASAAPLAGGQPVAATAPPAVASAARPARDPAAILAGQASASAPAGKAVAPVVAAFFVQAGAYARQEDAEAQRGKLALLGLGAKITEREQSGRTVYRVRLGPFDAREEAEDVQTKLGGAGIEANLVRVER